MGRIGYGFGTSRRSVTANGTAPPLIAPSELWQGTAGSGFTNIPADPLRTTAKPATRLLIPPFQWYDDVLLVGVFAAANNAGTLLDNMGIETVIVHYEGARHFIAAPSYQTMPDANGVPVTYFGWWVRLKHDGRNGHARLYFEAVPKDQTMQRRVVGPYQFSPQASVHDYTLDIAATPAEATGARYKTMASALSYLKSVNAKNPLVRFVEGGYYDLNGATNGWSSASWSNGYVHVTASAPVVLGRPAPAATADPSTFRPSCGLHLSGNMITLDFKSASELWNTDYAGRDHWLDGIKVTNSNGRYDLYRKSVRSTVGWLFRQSSITAGAWVTECNFTNLWNCLINTSLARGNILTSCWSDVFDHSYCVIGNRVDDWDSTTYSLPITALTVSYSGPEATATFERNGNTFTAKAGGVTIGTLTMGNSLAEFVANTNYTVQNLASWLNAMPGWSATALDNTRAGVFLTKTGYIPGTFPAVNVKNATAAFETLFDIHADWWQKQNGPIHENIVIADNVATNFVGQSVFWGNVDDMIVINNSWHNGDGEFIVGQGVANSRSQFGNTQRHMVFAHNTLATQRVWLRKDASGQFNPDGYSLWANNVVPSFEWLGGAADPDMSLYGNHMFDGYALPAGGGPALSQGGSDATLFVNAAAGDFTPSGQLLTNLKQPVVLHDANRKAREELAPAGAVAWFAD